MKALVFDNFNYYTYPDGITSLEQFAAYANKHFNEFVKMTELCTDNCRAPYFIKEDVKTVYINISQIESINECEVKGFLTKKEYEERLKKTVAEKCVHCTHYTESCEDNLRGHWDTISLDGECYGFERIKD